MKARLTVSGKQEDSATQTQTSTGGGGSIMAPHMMHSVPSSRYAKR